MDETVEMDEAALVQRFPELADMFGELGASAVYGDEDAPTSPSDDEPGMDTASEREHIAMLRDVLSRLQLELDEGDRDQDSATNAGRYARQTEGLT